MTSAEKTVNDVRGFCVRNPDVCADANEIAGSVVSRVKSSVATVQNWFSPQAQKDPKDQERLHEPVPPEPRSSPEPVRADPQWRNSLNPADRDVPWRGPQRL